MMTPFITATPNSAMKPTAEATFSVTPVTCSAIKPPSVASGTTPEDQRHLAERAELGVEKHDHQAEDEAEDEHKARFRPLLPFELPAPFQAVSARIELDLGGDRLCPAPPAPADAAVELSFTEDSGDSCRG